jgi:hypothetical protein
MTIYYCIHKGTNKPVLAGRVPEVWGNISGLADVRGADLEDLTWAGYPDHGFLTEDQATTRGVLREDLEASLTVAVRIEGAAVRAQRDKLLAAADWTQLSDVPEETKLAWAAHRQALRDITAQAGFPWTIDWPVAP